jgi:hypothetical protein
LKKRTKKLLFILASAFPDGLGPDNQKFFASFFQKRRIPSLGLACPANSTMEAPGRRDLTLVMVQPKVDIDRRKTVQ